MLRRMSRAELVQRAADLAEELEKERDTARALAAELDMATWGLREIRTYAQDHHDDPHKLYGWVIGITNRWALPGGPNKFIQPRRLWRGHGREQGARS